MRGGAYFNTERNLVVDESFLKDDRDIPGLDYQFIIYLRFRKCCRPSQPLISSAGT